MNKGSTVVLLVASVASGQTWLIRGARVFDGEKIVGTPDVLIRSGKIVAVTPEYYPSRMLLSSTPRAQRCCPG